MQLLVPDQAGRISGYYEGPIPLVREAPLKPFALSCASRGLPKHQEPGVHHGVWRAESTPRTPREAG